MRKAILISFLLCLSNTALGNECAPFSAQLYDDGGQCPCSKGEEIQSGCPDPSVWPDTWYTTVWRGKYEEDRCDRRESKGNHPGVDLKDVNNNPFLINGRYAALIAGPIISVNRDGWGGGWGNYVVQRVQSVDRNGNPISYMCFMGHLANNTIPSNAQNGRWFSCGEDLGDIGSTGSSTGPHGHWQCQICDDPDCQNEIKYFGDSECRSPVGECPYTLCIDGIPLDCIADKTINPIVALQDPDNDGYSRLNGDCDWNNSAISPSATENCNDGIDNNCNGLVDSHDPHCGAEPTMLSQMFFSVPSSGGAYDLGETITGSVVLRNNSSVPLNINDLTIGCRLNNASDCWNYSSEPNRLKCGEPDCPEFTNHTNITIQPGQNYNYIGTFTPNQYGLYACKVYYRVGPLECKGWNWDIPKAAAGYATTAYLSVANECAPAQSIARSSVNLLTTDCTPNTCSGKNAGDSCDDGLYCTTNDQCINSNGNLVCQGSSRNCNDNDSCTTDSCDESINKCTHASILNCGQIGQCAGQPNGTPCNDNNACTLLDQCLNGVCISNTNDCSQFNTQCSLGVCDPAVGCVQQPKSNGTTCNDGRLCTEIDTCQNGQCVGTDRDCNDNNPCTVDSCNETSLCTNIPGNAGIICREALWACDEPERCTGLSDLCPAHNNENKSPAGTPCSDGVFCNGLETCGADGFCYAGDEPCPYGLTTCDYYSCDENTDTCNVIGHKDQSIRCDDGLFCTQYDECDGQGNCVSYGDPCSSNFADGDEDCSETCDEETDSCTAPDPYSFNCTDGIWCNGTERCLNGECAIAGKQRCSDGEECDEINRTCIPAYSPTTTTPTPTSTPISTPSHTATITPSATIIVLTPTHTVATPSRTATNTQTATKNPTNTNTSTPSKTTTPTYTATTTLVTVATRTATPTPLTICERKVLEPINCPSTLRDCTTSDNSSISIRMVKNQKHTATNRIIWRLRINNQPDRIICDPTTVTEQTVCLYDGPNLVSQLKLPSTATCGNETCWKQVGEKSFRWFNHDLTQHSEIQKVRVSQNQANDLALSLFAKGENLPHLELPFSDNRITAQWNIDDNLCFQSLFFKDAGLTKETSQTFIGR